METRKHTGGSWKFGAYAQNRLRGIKYLPTKYANLIRVVQL